MNNKLSSREIQILELVSHGYPYKQVARLALISEQTVQNHMTTIRLKLGAVSSAQAVAIALRSGVMK